MKCSLEAQVRAAQSSETSLNPVDSDPTSLEPVLFPPDLPTGGSGLGGAVREGSGWVQRLQGAPSPAPEKAPPQTSPKPVVSFPICNHLSED